jgi:beta-galactosidase/beta-glucuronidase
MYRDSWRSLNGWWEFDFYDDVFVYSPEEKISAPLNQTIRVPYTYQTPLSGIGTEEIHEYVVYRRKIRFTDAERKHHVRLHFAAVDFSAEVRIDNTLVGTHRGGYTPFSFDISPFIGEKEEIDLSVVVTDKASPSQPRGKQAVGAPFECWYTAVTGIWQSVWLEFLPHVHIDSVSAVPDARSGSVQCRLQVSAPVEDGYIETELLLEGESVATAGSECRFPSTDMTLDVPEVRRWSPEDPALYEVVCSLVQDGSVIDRVETYTAFRELELKPDGVYIHNKRYFQKLVLMQGFWLEGGYTAPSEESFDEDIECAKEMGFNGCRMHIKFEDPRFLYAADRLGFLVWGEAPSFYSFSEEARAVFRKELTDIVLRDKMHPSLITWVIGNESWGLRDIAESAEMRAWLDEMVGLTRALDPTRPIVSNDGWEHLNSDVLTVHSYEHEAEALREDWNRAGRNEPCGILERRFRLNSKDASRVPWVLSEFGAVSYVEREDRIEHWGYGDAAESTEALLQRIVRLMEIASSLDGITGWCYTQFSDIEKEKNGLLFADRTPKIEPSRIRTKLEEIDVEKREVE